MNEERSGVLVAAIVAIVGIVGLAIFSQAGQGASVYVTGKVTGEFDPVDCTKILPNGKTVTVTVDRESTHGMEAAGFTCGSEPTGVCTGTEAHCSDYTDQASCDLDRACSWYMSSPG